MKVNEYLNVTEYICSTGQPRVLPQNRQTKPQIGPPRPSLANALKLLQPNKNAAMLKNPRISTHPLKNEIAKKTPPSSQYNKPSIKLIIAHQAHNAIKAKQVHNPTKDNKLQLKKPLSNQNVAVKNKLQALQLHKPLGKQIGNNDNVLQFAMDTLDGSAKRQKLWYPGQPDAGFSALPGIQEGIERSYALERQENNAHPASATPFYPATTDEIYFKLHNNLLHSSYSPNLRTPSKVNFNDYDAQRGEKKAMPAQLRPKTPGAKVYAKEDKLMKPFINSVDGLRKQPLIDTAGYDRSTLPHEDNTPSNPSTFAKRPFWRQLPEGPGARAIAQAYDTSAAQRTVVGGPTKTLHRSSLEEADVDKHGHDDAQVNSANNDRWEAIQRGQKQKWNEYQNEKNERWKGIVGPNGEPDSTAQSNQGPPTDQGKYDAQAALLAAKKDKSQNGYDYKTKVAEDNKGFDSSTEELSPKLGNIQVSMEKQLKPGGESKIVNIEMIDQSAKAKPQGNKPDMPGEKPVIPKEEKNPHGGKPDKPTGEMGKPDKPTGEMGKPDKPTGEMGKPDKPVGEMGKPDKPTGEMGKPDKPVGEMGKPDKPVGEMGKPDKPPRKPCPPGAKAGSDKGKEPSCCTEEDKECQGVIPINPPMPGKPIKPDSDRPPETTQRLVEEALLNKMEQKLASVLSLIQYVGGSKFASWVFSALLAP